MEYTTELISKHTNKNHNTIKSLLKNHKSNLEKLGSLTFKKENPILFLVSQHPFIYPPLKILKY